jgi:hypothetical protein
MYRLAQCGIGSTIPGFRIAAEASLAVVWNYTRCYMHYTILMAPMVARIPYHSPMLFAIHLLMWAMFALQLFWGGVMVKMAIQKFLLGKSHVTNLTTAGAQPQLKPRIGDEKRGN